ncbi:hypothetical protein ATANTOWER_029902 [Ataeniobius toweri]|uniref:Uncharacterized protein n=1 Tax=Ataeniobius toweri TaxID=208326 RepID=A0ABU7ALK2_9TELE|nr:hypothetical protein [Ataeniobius toweri]
MRAGIDQTHPDPVEWEGEKAKRFSFGFSCLAKTTGLPSGLLSSYTGLWVVSGLPSERYVTLLADLGRLTSSAPLLWAAMVRQVKLLRILLWLASSMADVLALSQQRVKMKRNKT